MTPPRERDGGQGSPAAGTGETSGLFDVGGAATYLGVTEAFVRRLVLERRVRYFKLGKFVRFRAADLDAFVEAGRHEPVAPWVHTRSTPRRAATRTTARQPKPGRQTGASPRQQAKPSRR